MNFSRRLTLQAILGTLATAQFTRNCMAVLSDELSTADKFKNSLANQPWLKVYENVSALALPPQPASISGDWPAEMSGSLFRNGPAHFERGGHRYDHWFDGDGMIQKWSMRDSLVSHSAKIISTSKFRIEESVQRHQLDGFATQMGREFAMHPDDLNTSNTSVVAHGDELWTLWEGGSPHLIDPDSLETLGIKTFSSSTDGIAFSAHPRVDKSGSLWNFGVVSHLGKLAIWEISKRGLLRQFQVIDVHPMSMPHDFVVTEHHIVILLAPLWYDIDRSEHFSFLHSHQWHPDEPTRVLVIKKNDANDHFIAELPAQWVFHFTNAWESDSIIQFEGCAYEDPSIMFDVFTSIMAGRAPTTKQVHSKLTRYRIDLQAHRASQEIIFGNSQNLEFPTFDRRLSSSRHRWVNFLGISNTATVKFPSSLLDTLIRIDMDRGTQQSYTYPPTELPEEHLFVPDRSKAGEDVGWVVGTSIDWNKEETRLNVFHVDRIADGPIATATVPRMMPLGLHGFYV